MFLLITSTILDSESFVQLEVFVRGCVNESAAIEYNLDEINGTCVDEDDLSYAYLNLLEDELEIVSLQELPREYILLSS